MSCKDNFQQKCKVFFDKCNGGDPITIQQLVAVIREACPSYKGEDSEIAMMFADVDDGDEMITWDEFSTKLCAKKHCEVTRAELEETFKGIDKDGSGKLSKEEIKRLAMEVGGRSEEEVDETMKMADADKDGQIDFNEFLKAWKSSAGDE